ncbi:hypothetical protein DL96DRAFT_1601905 [Flagelloscypha sp. PMI_526]|nr:hypothetical protein DL96DRAFT_1601905 [Flagelloscypha sp. PMI_526]
MSSSKAQGPTSRRRSCDLCRKKKIRCDGPYNSEPSCSYCRTRRLLCKYDDIPRKITTKVSGSLSLQTTSAVSVATTPTNGADEAKLSEEDMDHFCGTSVTHLVDKLSNVHLDEHPGFYGTSSTATFIQAARRSINPLAQQKMKDMRPYFWTAREWEANSTISLIDLYFNHLNIYYPLLHRPTFEEAWRTGRQSTDLSFAYTSLLVFANAARLDENSAGWKWFNQVSLSSRRPMLAPATLFDLQIYALSAIFLLSSSSGQTCWEIAGSGVRMGQSVGAHKKRRWTSDGHPSAQDELWKKAFWVLVVLDNNLSASFGRQTAIQDEGDINFSREDLAYLDFF